MQNVIVRLKKLSITEEQKNLVLIMASKKMSGRRIAMELGLNQITIWRNMEFLGINNKKCPNKEPKRSDIFDWKDYDNSVI